MKIFRPCRSANAESKHMKTVWLFIKYSVLAAM